MPPIPASATSFSASPEDSGITGVAVAVNSIGCTAAAETCCGPAVGWVDGRISVLAADELSDVLGVDVADDRSVFGFPPSRWRNELLQGRAVVVAVMECAKWAKNGHGGERRLYSRRGGPLD